MATASGVTSAFSTRRWATYRPPSSRHNGQRKTWRPLRGSFLCAFSEAWEIYRSDVGVGNAGSRSSSPPPALIGLDEFQLAIPWPGGLHQSPEGELGPLVEDFQRTAKYLLTGCLTPGGKCKLSTITQSSMKSAAIVALPVSGDNQILACSA
jgi:hypothetical protein